MSLSEEREAWPVGKSQTVVRKIQPFLHGLGRSMGQPDNTTHTIPGLDYILALDVLNFTLREVLFDITQPE